MVAVINEPRADNRFRRRKIIFFPRSQPYKTSILVPTLGFLTQAEAVRQAQALVRQQVPPSRSLVEELLAERRAEAASE